MKTFAPRPAAQETTAAPASKATALADHRPAAVAQRQLQAAIAASPRQAAPAPLAAPRRNTTGLPDQLKAGVESLSGHSLDDVKVHYNSAKPSQLQALAYAQGTDIHIGPGQEKHLPHEAWHVVQQKQGRVRATRQMRGGISLNDNINLEREADKMGAISLVKQAANEQLIESAPSRNNTVQRTVAEDLKKASGYWNSSMGMQHDAQQNILPKYDNLVRSNDDALASAGLVHWTKTHLTHTDASLAELKTMAAHASSGNRYGGEYVRAYLGSDVKNMPDSMVISPKVTMAIENKTSNSDDQGAIDKLIRGDDGAHKQLGLPRSSGASTHRAVINISSANNPWPYTPTTVPAHPPTPYELGEVAAKRNLRNEGGLGPKMTQIHVNSARFGSFQFAI